MLYSIDALVESLRRNVLCGCRAAAADFPQNQVHAPSFPPSCILHCRTRSVSYSCSSVSTTLGDMANPGVGSAVYDKITNVVTWKAEKILAGTEALIRITMMQGSDEPLSINVQVERFCLLPIFSFIDEVFRCPEYL